MLYIAEWEWDDGNTEHIAQRGLTPADIEDVWLENPKYRRNRNQRAASHQMIGPDRGGRYLTVFIRQTEKDEGLWRTVTARESTAPEIEWWRKS